MNGKILSAKLNDCFHLCTSKKSLLQDNWRIADALFNIYRCALDPDNPRINNI